MAEEKDSKNKQDTPPTEKKDNSKKKLFIIIGVATVLLIAITVVATILIVKKSNNSTFENHSEKKHHKEEKKEEKEEKKEEKKEESHEHGASAEEGAVSTEGQPVFFKLRPAIVVTIPSEGRARYVQIEVDVMTRSTADVKACDTYSPLIKAELIDLFGRTSFEEITTEQGKLNLRNKSLEVIKKIMKDNSVEVALEQVLFTNFIIQ